MAKKIIAATLLGIYFVFTSGFVFEVIKSEDVDTVNIPYSIALSGDRLGILGLFTQDDINCAQWLGKTEGESFVMADYNGINLCSDYIPGYKRIITTNIYRIRASANKTYARKFYLLLTTWNVENGKMVVGISSGMRSYEPLPDVSKLVEVYRSGKARVYYSDDGQLPSL